MCFELALLTCNHGTPVEADWKAAVVWKIDVAIPIPTGDVAHNCDALAGIIPKQNAGGAAVSFYIGVDGRVVNPYVYRSSGQLNFDAALAKCVANWTYTPATRNGQPIEAQWGAKFSWPPTSAQMTSIDGYARPHLCGDGWYPRRAREKGAEGTTILTFQILEDGKIDQIGISQSSGDDTLDKAAAQCATYWKYLPAVSNGKPIAVSWSAQVTWTHGHAFVVEIPQPSTTLANMFKPRAASSGSQ